MKLIALVSTALAIAIGAAAFTMGDPTAGLLILLIPFIGWLGFLARRVHQKNRKAEEDFLAARMRQHEEEYVKMKEASRVRAEAEYARAVRSRIPTPQGLQQQAHLSRVAAAQQQQSIAGAGFGFLDPRSTYAAQQSSSNFLSDTVSALMVQQMMNSGTAVVKTHYDHDTDTVVVKSIPVENLYREPDPEPQRSYSSDTSSSSSSSSDTSSDSYGGSDTSSDSF